MKGVNSSVRDSNRPLSTATPLIVEIYYAKCRHFDTAAGAVQDPYGSKGAETGRRPLFQWFTHDVNAARVQRSERYYTSRYARDTLPDCRVFRVRPVQLTPL